MAAVAYLAMRDGDPDEELRLNGARVVASIAQNLHFIRHAYVKVTL